MSDLPEPDEPDGTPCTPDDRALLARLLEGDEAAYVTLVGRYHGRLLRLAALFVSSRASAEEVVQETWLGVIGGLARFEGRSSLKSWIFRILINRARTRGVSESRTQPFSALQTEAARSADAVDPSRFTTRGRWASPPPAWGTEAVTPEQQLLWGELRGVMEAALAELPPAQRLVVTLRDVDGLDSKEACNVLSLSETNQRVLLHRGRAKLRAAIEAHLRRE